MNDASRAHLDSERILLGAAETAAGLADDPDFTKMTKYALGTMGKPLLECLAPTDRASLYVPVQMQVGEKREPGSILALEDRALFSWFTGTLRVRVFVESVPFQTISKIEETALKGSTFQVALNGFVVFADRAWTAWHYPFTPDGISFMLRGHLEGWAVPQFDG